jgi:SAM-dependent methyltransferase
MDPALRRAWTETVTAADYEQHMSNIGQAQAIAALTQFILQSAPPPEDGSILVVGAGTGQMLDYLDPLIFRPYRITCTDLNREFLDRLEQRCSRQGIRVTTLVDDVEHTKVAGSADLILAALLLEHIDWRRGVEAIAGLAPRFCGIVTQENPPAMTSAVTPGRRLPTSVAKAMETAHPILIPHEELIEVFAARSYVCTATRAEPVADGKRLVATVFEKLQHRPQ